jgi:uncharacterized protein with beta-barrel porin domain
MTKTFLMVKTLFVAGLTMGLAGTFMVILPATQSFAQVNGGNGAVDSSGGDGGGGGGGGGFGGGSGGLGASGAGNGSTGMGGDAVGFGGGGAGVGGGGGGFMLGGNGGVGAPGSGTIGELTNTGTIQGGAGSGGGGGGGAGIGGGGGDPGRGAGGAAGFTITNFTITNSGTISGGAGGSSYGGGDGGAGIGNGGGGIASGNGGAGLNGLIIINSGTIRGGNGGAANGDGAPGAGGAGISGSGMTITNLGTGTISGGLNGDGVTRANAITFTSGSNTLTLQTGFVITGNIAIDAGTLTFNQSTAQTLSNIMTGAGGVIDHSTGTLTLSGANTYAGATVVNAGTLNVTGSIASSVLTTVNADATLTGTGVVGATQINAGGIFAPGGTPGSSMTVASLTLAASAQYMVQLNPTTSSFAHVTGAATLGGATVDATFAGGSYISKQYTILTAGSLTGAFGSVVNTNLPTNFRTTLSYDAKDAYLNLALNFAPPITPSGPSAPNFGGGLNVNQQNVANTLTNFFNTTGGIPLVFGTLTPAGLTQVSGEAATGSQQTTFDAMNLFMGVMTDPFANGRGDAGTAGAGAATGYASTQGSGATHDAYAMFTKAAAVAPFEARWSTWAAGFGGSQTTDGNATLSSNNTTSSVYGTAVGADYRISPYTIAGFALAGGGTNFSVANSGSGHSDLFQAGAFVRHDVGAAYISAALAYGWQEITTNRTVTAAGTSQLRAQFDANAFSGRLEGGYRFVAPWVGGIGITPYAAAQFTTFDLPAYAEQATVGSNAFALAYGAKDVTDTRSELGIRTDKSWAMTDGILTLRGRLAWAHDYDPDRSIGATFQTLPGASFVVNGAAQAADSALVTASVEKKWLNGWSAAATFEGEFSDVTRSYAGKGVVRYQW